VPVLTSLPRYWWLHARDRLGRCLRPAVTRVTDQTTKTPVVVPSLRFAGAAVLAVLSRRVGPRGGRVAPGTFFMHSNHYENNLPSIHLNHHEHNASIQLNHYVAT